MNTQNIKYMKFDNPILRQYQKYGYGITEPINDLKHFWLRCRVGAIFGAHPYIEYPEFLKSLSKKDILIFLEHRDRLRKDVLFDLEYAIFKGG